MRRIRSIDIRNTGRAAGAVRWVGRSGLVAAAPAFLAYLATLAPGVYGFDSAELATGAYTLGIVHPSGYPLYLVLSRLFMFLPIGTIAFRANLFSAVLGALTVALLFRLLLRLSGSMFASLVGSLSVAFAIGFWRMAIVAEVYTLQTALTVLLMALLVEYTSDRRQRWLLLAGIIYGLSLSNHVSSAMYAPAIAIVVLSTSLRSNWLRIGSTFAIGLAVGLTPYLYFPLRASEATGVNYVATYYGVDLRTLPGIIWMVTGQAYRFFVFGYDWPAYARELVGFASVVWRNFTGLGILIGAVGWWSLWKRPALLLLTSWIFLVTAVFVSGYAVQDKETMYLPALLMAGLWVGLGVVKILAWTHSRKSIPGMGVRTALSACAPLMVVLAAALNWAEVDLSDSDEPQTFAFYTLESVEDDAVIIGGWSPAVILEYYQQVEGMRPDVTIFNRSRFEVAEYYQGWVTGADHATAVADIEQAEAKMIRDLASARPVYDVRYSAGLAEEFEYRPVGGIFRLVPRSSVFSE